MRRRTVAYLLSCAALAPLLVARQAQATEVVGGTGAYLAFSFGEKLGVGWGIEGFATSILVDGYSTCDRSAGLGGVVQVGAVGLEAPRVVMAAQGGGDIDTLGLHSAVGELGATYRFGERSGLGLHTGLLMAVPFTYSFVRAAWGLNDYAVGGGVRVTNRLGTFKPPGCTIMTTVEGRALRDAAGNMVAGPAWANRGGAEGAVAGSGAGQWAEGAQHEWASVPAFLQLAHELHALGAPRELVRAALRAAGQEVQHTAMCVAMAARNGAAAVEPRFPANWTRPILPGVAGFCRLAVESWIDGCLGEGFAAARAAAAAAATNDPLARQVLTQIARDEGEHAELAWRVLAWALRDSAASREVYRAVEAARAFGLTPREQDAAYGCLAVDETTVIAREQHRASALRLERLCAA